MHFPGLKFKNLRLRGEVHHRSREILEYLSVEIGERSLNTYENLERARSYILESFKSFGYEPVEDVYKVSGREVANIIVEKKGILRPEEIIVIGAHYDTVEGSPGADDNGSAVTALLETARLLESERMDRTLRLIAFTMEEPPCYGSRHMGSRRIARKYRKNKEQIKLMICLEMLGYASSAINQEPFAYGYDDHLPSAADFLVVATLPSCADAALHWKKIYNSLASKGIYEVVAPASVPGIELSDHSSFIREGFPAIMLTDTGFYRNKNYHSATDSIYTINFRFLSDNIINITNALKELVNYREQINYTTLQGE